MSASRWSGRGTGQRRSRATECTSTYLACEQVDPVVDAGPEEFHSHNQQDPVMCHQIHQ